ncbi:MAG: ribbon-helix-helix domain-containing protein [Candidatus Micrarchaeia archaeon]
MQKLSIKFSDEEIALIDRRIKEGWAANRPEVIRQAIFYLYLRRKWLGARKFRAEMMKAKRKLDKLKEIKSRYI